MLVLGNTRQLLNPIGADARQNPGPEILVLLVDILGAAITVKLLAIQQWHKMRINQGTQSKYLIVVIHLHHSS